MVKKALKSKYLFIFFLSILLMLNITIIKSSHPSVYDQALIFTQDEKSQLEKQAKIIFDKYNMDVVIVSSDDTGSKSSQVYADDFYDDNNLGQNSSKDGLLLLIDLDNREVYISTSGKALNYFSDQRLDNIINQILENGMIDGDYYQASMTFLNSTNDYLSKDSVIKPSKLPKVKGIKALTPLKAGLSLGLAALLSALFNSKTKLKYKMKKPIKYNNFRKNSEVKFIKQEDRYIKTEVIEKTIENTTTTHTSSKGKVHGGSGGKF